MLQGEANIPYINIKGSNIDNGIKTLGLSGSTNPDEITNPYGNGLSIAWQLPGGITGKRQNNDGLWGYAVTPKIHDENVDVDSTVKNWLMGNEVHARIQPTHLYSDEVELDEAINNNDTTIISDINRLMIDYAARLFDIGDEGSDYDLFKTTFIGCYRSI